MAAKQRRRLVKLVRDRVGQFIGNAQRVTYEPISSIDHVPLLRAKLVEEVVEYLQNPSIGEAADVFEALRGLAEVDLACTIDEIEAEANAKRAARGGFDEGTGMFVTTFAPERHEGQHGGG